MVKKQTSIKDIANKLNIHFTTVARALRGHPDVSQKTRELVLQTAQQMNYHPNRIATSLKLMKTKTVGVIVPDIKHNFFSSVIGGIEEVVYRSGYSLMVCQSNEDFEREKINLRALASNQVAGILISISQTTKCGDHFKNIIEDGTHIVFFDRICEEVKASKVIINDRESAAEAVNFLFNKGYRKIAYFAGSPDIYIARERLEGYKQSIENNGLELNQNHIYFGGLLEEDGYKSMSKLLEKKELPDSIFCVNDPVAIGAYKRIKEAGLKIPSQIALVGFSNHHAADEFIDPPLTTVNQPSYEMGYEAAQLLLDEIENRDEDFHPKTKVLRAELIIRNSA